MILNPYRFSTTAPATAFDGFGNASRSFDGSSYITAPDGSWLPRGEQTWACWLKYNSSAVYAFFNHNGSSPNRSIQMVITTAGKIQFQVSADGRNREDFVSNSSISQGDWHHVACVFNPSASTGQGRRIYINGTLDQNGSTNYTLLHDSNQDVGMGANGAGLFNLDGSLADCRIYDADIGDAGVSDLYAGTDIQTNLVGHWLKDTDDVLDHAGVNDGTNNGSTYSYDNPSPAVEFGNASRFFNGSNNFVNMGDVDGSVWQGASAQFSGACWIKPTSIGGNSVILGKARFDNAQYEWALERQGAAIRMIWAGALNASSYWGEVTGNVLTSNVWTHVGFSYDGTQALADRIKIYIDGSLATFSDLSAGTPSEIQNGTQPFAIGGTYLTSTTADLEFTGYIADVRIYDTDLSSSDIADLYAGTHITTNLVGHWLTNNDDVLDYAGTNDGTNNGSIYSTDSPF